MLKDLWTADLPLGGNKATGAGVLEGVRAEIIDGHQAYTIISSNSNISVNGDHTELENIVKTFANIFSPQN